MTGIGGGMQHRAGAELGHVKAHALLGAAKTGVAGSYRPAARTCIAKLGGGAVGIGDRPFAAQIIKAVAEAVAFIAKFARKAAVVKVRPAFAMFVNKASIGELGPVFGVQCRQFVEGKVVDDGGEQIVGIWRTTRHVDHLSAR